jgi:hypothetical protein
VLTLDRHGVNGIDFPRGDTGIAALGDGYFYVSHHGRNPEGQYTDVKLWRAAQDVFALV